MTNSSVISKVVVENFFIQPGVIGQFISNDFRVLLCGFSYMQMRMQRPSNNLSHVFFNLSAFMGVSKVSQPWF